MLTTEVDRVQEQLRIVREFAAEFGRAPLYNAGYADAFANGGAAKAETLSDMGRSLSYVIGCANTARIACEYLSPAWQIAHLVGIAAGTLLCKLDAGDCPESFAKVIDTYRRELTDLAAKRAA